MFPVPDSSLETLSATTQQFVDRHQVSSTSSRIKAPWPGFFVLHYGARKVFVKINIGEYGIG